jgi:endoglucanase
MRKALASLASALAVLAMPAAATAESHWLQGLQGFRPIAAVDQSRALGRGINIMGADPFFEANHGSRFKERYFRDIAERGFQTVRVPQFVLEHADADGNLDPRWLAKMDWVVRSALRNGLNVIIDNNGGCSHDVAETCMERTARTWAVLARHYRHTPNSVLFELYNEPDHNLTPQAWNVGLLTILKAIRASNPTRNVVIGPAHSYSLRSLADLQLPANDHHIIASFHYYEPFLFTHQGASWLAPERRPPVGARFGSLAEVFAVTSDLDYVAQWSAWAHRPVFLGEFGTLEAAASHDRVLWTQLVARQAERHGISWAYWQFDNNFTAYDSAADHWVMPILRALIP